MTQTAAILLDAYRELNARKLFWITLIISGVVVAAFAMIGVNENGVRLLLWDVDVFGVDSTTVPPDQFYKGMFLYFGVGFWLTWAAAILALISTASIFPDFITGGSIDLVLSKPIGRWRLFFTKYASGLLFVALQVSVFSVASFLVIGFRGGVWEWGVFLAIPIVVVFFSYLFCICVLLGVLTRSTIAALLLTVLCWLGIFIVHSAETSLLLFHRMKEHEVQRLDGQIERQRENLELVRTSGAPDDALQRIEATIEDRRVERDRAERQRGHLGLAHGIALGIMTALPKTTETTALMQRSLVDPTEVSGPFHTGDDDWAMGDMEAAQVDAVESIRKRTVTWIVGTSLIFEAFVLLLAGWIFVRRDF